MGALVDVKGPSYGSVPVFDLLKMQPYPLSALMDLFQDLTDDVVLYLPRTSDLQQLSTYVEDQSKLAVVHYCMNGASKVSRKPLDESNLTGAGHVRFFWQLQFDGPNVAWMKGATMVALCTTDNRNDNLHGIFLWS